LFVGEQMDAQQVRMVLDAETTAAAPISYPAPPFVLSIYSNFRARGLAF
jgi:hypothetical protein